MTLAEPVTQRIKRLWLILVLGGMCCIGSAYTGSAPAHVQKELPGARLAGQGSFSWFGLKLYDAKFWVGEFGYQSSEPSAARFVLELQYSWTMDGARIADASLQEIEKLGQGSALQRKAWLAEMKNLFPDVKDGTRISGVYLPLQGARFYLDGKLLGDIPDPEFARAFFAIWLDPKTSDKKLRSALLADAAPR